MGRILKVSVERKTFWVSFEGGIGGRWCSITEHSKGSAFILGFEKEEGMGTFEGSVVSMLVVPSSGFDEKVSEERPRRGGLVSVGRWARAVVCECQDDSVNWDEVGRALARRLGHKGVVTVVPFAGGKALFFVETLEEAVTLHESRFIKIKGGNTVLLRKWSPKENSEIEGKFKEGWIELRGLPFHLWSEVHLKKIMEQWGTVTEIDWRTLKIFYLSKARVRVVMKERSVLPALIEVVDGVGTSQSQLQW
ncbi:hypothetical protein CK203_020791 [Vitis vinifera]|uniref:Uncharacterized protein n=1 Tax=Vitis vinifera TaxID=29760 RepID=A0A438IHV8_VITVI|nr:hypothetical protein CK203_020791 [Vitis vinifera]